MEEIDRRENLGEEYAELIGRHRKKRRAAYFIAAAIIIGVIFTGKIIMSSPNASSWLPGGSFFNTIRRLVTGEDRQLQGEENDRVNILLLGMGGEGHDGAYLTDTMLLVSIKPSTKQVAMLSLPRDLVSPVSNWQKINSINAYAEQKNPGSGGEMTKKAIGELLQVPIQYYVRADFGGFVRVIDELGGVEVDVENTLNDYSYPIEGQEDNPNYYARFEHLHIDKGPQTMDGSLALKYTRSRHAAGMEGSDFARARRQQLVIEAMKNKLLSEQTLLNPIMIGRLISEFNKDVSTDLNVWEIIRLWNLTKDVNRDQVINKVLSDAPDGLLVAGTGEDGAFILVPRSGNFAAVRQLAQNIFSLDSPKPAKAEVIASGASIIINNGTFITGLANRTSAALAGRGFTVLKIGNAPQRDYTQTTVYDLSSGKKVSALSSIEKATGAKQGDTMPDWLASYISSLEQKPDFFLLLGTDADKAEN